MGLCKKIFAPATFFHGFRYLGNDFLCIDTFALDSCTVRLYFLCKLALEAAFLRIDTFLRFLHYSTLFPV